MVIIVIVKKKSNATVPGNSMVEDNTIEVQNKEIAIANVETGEVFN